MALSTETTFPGNVRTPGRGIFGAGVDIADGQVTNAKVGASPTVPIDAEKLEHQPPIHVVQESGTAVVSKTYNVHIARGAGEAIGMSAMVDVAPTGADRTIIIDVKKGNQATGFATLLTTTITINNATVAREVKDAVLVGLPIYAADDTLQITVTVAGAAGAQGQGLNVTLWTREKPEP